MSLELTKLKKEEVVAMNFSIIVFTLTSMLILGIIFLKLKIVNLRLNNYLGVALMFNGIGSATVAFHCFKLKKRIIQTYSALDFRLIKKSLYKSFFINFCIPYLISVVIFFTINDFRTATTMLLIMIFTWAFIYIFDWKKT